MFLLSRVMSGEFSTYPFGGLQVRTRKEFEYNVSPQHEYHRDLMVNPCQPIGTTFERDSFISPCFPPSLLVSFLEGFLVLGSLLRGFSNLGGGGSRLPTLKVQDLQGHSFWRRNLKSNEKQLIGTNRLEGLLGGKASSLYLGAWDPGSEGIFSIRS